MPLDSYQQAAVDHEGSLVLAALPGSGKTTTLVARLNKLRSQGKRVLAMTFTKNASKNIVERMDKTCDTPCTVGTIHSVCLNVLRRNGEKRALLSDYGFKSIVTSIAKEIERPAESIYKILTDCREGQLKPTESMMRVLTLYRDARKKANLIDFSDILLLFNMPQTDIGSLYFDEIMVDEFQDINVLQMNAINKILDKNKHASLFVVGDVNQCIYQWRSASPDIMQEMIDGGEIPTKWLQYNYRSADNIIHVANSIAPNGKHMIGVRKVPGTVSVVSGNDFDNKMMQVGKACVETYHSTAMLCRTSSEVRIAEKTLTSYGIPCKVINMMSLTESFEYKDMVALMTLIVNQEDWTSWNRVSKCIPGIGKKFVDNVRTSSSSQAIEMIRGKSKRDELDKFLTFLKESSERDPVGIIDNVMERYYYDYLKKVCTCEDEESGRLETINIIKDRIKHFATTQEALDDLTTIASSDAQQSNMPLIEILTMHGSKGLEWDCVIIPFCQEGSMPHQLSVRDGNIDEETRLAYVAFSRARNELIIMFDKNRVPSRYIQHHIANRSSVVKQVRLI